MKSSTKKIVWAVGGIVALVLIVVLSGMLKSAGGISSARGELQFSGLDNNTRVFVDNERQQLKTNGEVKSVFVVSGHRDILVSKDGYWPWLKQIDIKAGSTTELAPFLFPQKPAVEVVGEDDPEYEALVSMVSSSHAPTEPNMLVSKDMNVTVWKSGNAIKARWIGKSALPATFCAIACESEITVLNATTPIQTFAFWRGRNDLIIVAAGTDIYALELDRRPVQNYQPIIKGVAPSFALTKTGALYALDNNVLYHLNIDEE